MINPLSSATALPAVGQPTSSFDRPPVQPDAAVQVTQTEQGSLQGNAANSQEGGMGNSTAGQSPHNALDKVNKAMEAWSTGMRFEMDEDAQRLVVSIVDNETGEVLRKVPSDAVLQVAKMIVQMQGGSVNTKA